MSDNKRCRFYLLISYVKRSSNVNKQRVLPDSLKFNKLNPIKIQDLRNEVPQINVIFLPNSQTTYINQGAVAINYYGNDIICVHKETMTTTYKMKNFGKWKIIADYEIPGIRFLFRWYSFDLIWTKDFNLRVLLKGRSVWFSNSENPPSTPK